MNLKRFIFFSVTVLTAVALWADVSLAMDKKHRGGRLPPEIAEQLTAEQLTEFENTAGFRAKRDLLESWGIKMPKRPKRGDGQHRPPPPGEFRPDPENQIDGGVQ